MLILAAFSTHPALSAESAKKPVVKLQTSMGDIVLELYPDKAPATVTNFLTYVRDGFYNGTVFHRVISNFMIQGGGFTEGLSQKPTRDPIKNEANNGLSNTRGTLAMARTADPHSASAQFFINTADNTFLDYQAETTRGFGYAVFGKVISGMDTVEKIRNTPTGSKGPFPKDVPVTSVVIKKATVETDKK
ncbi:MAG: peptidylprolyl isomerase [Gammaproteobacteria bacterium]|nr:peptidylprolyl isomerase [Gammaproteobacteria bacterium]